MNTSIQANEGNTQMDRSISLVGATALVIGAVALELRTGVVSLIAGVVLRQGAQAIRRQQVLLDRGDDLLASGQR